MMPLMRRLIFRTQRLDQLTRVKPYCGTFSQNGLNMSSMVFRTSMVDTCRGLALANASSLGINISFVRQSTGAMATKILRGSALRG